MRRKGSGSRTTRRRQSAARASKVRRSRGLARARKVKRAKRAETKVRIQSDMAKKRLEPDLEENHSHLNQQGEENYYPDTTVPRFLSTPDSFDPLCVQPFWNMNQGFGSDEMVGDTIASKKIVMKVRIDWPRAENLITRPIKLYLVHGWVTAPLAATDNTSVKRNDVPPAMLKLHTQQQVQEYFDNKKDILDFTERATTNVKILGYQKMVPKPDQITSQIIQNTQYPGTDVSTGAPTYTTKIATWHTNRRVVYTLGSEGDASADGNTADALQVVDTHGNASPLLDNWYPNNQWLPFACIYMPDNNEFLNANNQAVKPLISYNVAHYFTDA